MLMKGVVGGEEYDGKGVVGEFDAKDEPGDVASAGLAGVPSISAVRCIEWPLVLLVWLLLLLYTKDDCSLDVVNVAVVGGLRLKYIETLGCCCCGCKNCCGCCCIWSCWGCCGCCGGC